MTPPKQRGTSMRAEAPIRCGIADDLVAHAAVETKERHSAFAFVRICATLLEHVCGVVFRCPKKEMVWTTAQWRVAVMTHKARVIIRDWSIGQLIGDAMGLDAAPTKPELPVSTRINISDPYPTGIAFVNTWPKSDGGIGAFVIVAAFLRTILANLRDVIGHRLAASCARLRDFFCSMSRATVRVTAMGTKPTRFARASHGDFAAHDTHALDLRSIGSWHFTSIIR
jgi:hypothetical protein